MNERERIECLVSGMENLFVNLSLSPLSPRGHPCPAVNEDDSV